jgi:hypothetical protein
MKRLFKVVVPVAAIGIAGCGDTLVGPTTIDPDALAGTWNARSYAFIDPTELNPPVDLIGRGASLTVTFRSDGTYTWNFTDVDGTNTVITGTFTVTNDVQVNFSDVGEGTTEAFLATREEDRMTLATGLAEWDFEEDGTPEQAEWRIFLVRNGG